MVAVGMVLIWGGYSVSLWGWCLLRGYDVPFGQLVSPVHPYSGRWPPAPVPDTQIWPSSGKAAAAGSPAGLAAPPIASQAALGNMVSSVLNQFKSHPPTPTGNPTATQQLTGGA